MQHTIVYKINNQKIFFLLYRLFIRIGNSVAIGVGINSLKFGWWVRWSLYDKLVEVQMWSVNVCPPSKSFVQTLRQYKILDDWIPRNQYMVKIEWGWSMVMSYDVHWTRYLILFKNLLIIYDYCTRTIKYLNNFVNWMWLFSLIIIYYKSYYILLLRFMLYPMICIYI